MRKANNREHNMIIEIKDQADDIFGRCNYSIPNLCNYIMAEKCWMKKVALATVFATGEFVNGNQFMLPTTKQCCINFKDAEKRMKKKRPLKIYNENCWNEGWKVTREYETFEICYAHYECKTEIEYFD